MRDQRAELIQEMVDYGELLDLGDGMYEDMGGHIIHDSNTQMLDSYIDSFLKGLPDNERLQVLKRTGVA